MKKGPWPAHNLEEKIAAFKDEPDTLKETLARSMISENAHYVKLVKNLFTLEDFLHIQERTIGKGRLGGKATGMLLGYKAIEKEQELFSQDIRIPSSWFIGSEVFSNFLHDPALRKFEYIKDFDERLLIDDAFSNEFLASSRTVAFSAPIIAQITDLLRETQGQPLVIRSSSLLEDAYGTSFAGIYDSYFLPNTFNQQTNKKMFIDAMRRIYASVFRTKAIEYRRNHRQEGLLKDYEAMALLVQKVVGTSWKSEGHHYFAPVFAGVGFSHNDYAWKGAKPKDGAVRIALGLGTAAVDVGTEEDTPFYSDLTRETVILDEDTLKQRQRSVHLIDLDETDLEKVVKKIRIDDLDEALPYLDGIEDAISVERKGKFYPATKAMFPDIYPLITFQRFPAAWKETLKLMHQVIVFYHAREDLRHELDVLKYRTAEEVMPLVPTEMQKKIEEDRLVAMDTDRMHEYLNRKGYAEDKTRQIIGKLGILIESKTALESLERYQHFRETAEAVQDRTIRRIIRRSMERHAIDTEFAKANEMLYLVQCRPLRIYDEHALDKNLEDIADQDKFFDVPFRGPTTQQKNRWVIFVDDDGYTALPMQKRYALKDSISSMNARMKEEGYLLLVPGRTGTQEVELGIPVDFKDVDNSRFIIEYPLKQHDPEFSFMSHFGKNIIEKQIIYAIIKDEQLFSKKLLREHAKESLYDGALLLIELPMTIYTSRDKERIIAERR
ncbi:MAG: hypothetical protein GXP63_05025 [DPANN group archaeon]|nr:hypothetical protein [DPANN group archaeon]